MRKLFEHIVLIVCFIILFVLALASNDIETYFLERKILTLVLWIGSIIVEIWLFYVFNSRGVNKYQRPFCFVHICMMLYLSNINPLILLGFDSGYNMVFLLLSFVFIFFSLRENKRS